MIQRAVLSGEAHKLGAATIEYTKPRSFNFRWQSRNEFYYSTKYWTKARRRRFAYKSKFWEKVIQEIVNKDASIQTVDNWNDIYNVFRPFIGKRSKIFAKN